MKFVDHTAAAGLKGSGYSFGAAAGDYNADGRPDLLVAGLRQVTLYRNEGGRFLDVTKAAGLDNRGRWSAGAAWLDIENDGDLDLFVVNYVKWEPSEEKTCLVNGKPDFCHPRHYAAQPNALFRNNGDGTFTDVSEATGISSHLGKGMGVAAADFDADGLADLFVTNDRQFNFFFRNQGGGKFREEAFPRGVAVPHDGKPPSAMGVDAQDFDNDGQPDLIYTALRDETFPLYRNAGAEFVESTATSDLAVLTRSMSGWGVAFADLDNDGWKDVAVARSDALSSTGGKGMAAKEPPAWLKNKTSGKFAAGEGMEGIRSAMYRGLIAADLDDDGCLDLVLTALQERARILRNPCTSGGHWVKVNAGAGVARIRAGEQWRETATSAVGYASSYAGPVHFGLGPRNQVEVEVFWHDGSRKTVAAEANRTVQVQR
jgi:hypothetical protein